MGLFAALHICALLLLWPFWIANHHAPASIAYRHLSLDIKFFKGLPYFWLNHLGVASWGFSTDFFWGKNKTGYSIMTCNILCLTKAQSGLVSLAAYPISTVIPLDLSSESSIIPCVASIVHETSFARYSVIQHSASCHVSSWDHSVLACRGFSTNLFCEKKVDWIFILDMKYFTTDEGPVWACLSCNVSNIHCVCHWSEQWINTHLPVWHKSSWWRLLPLCETLPYLAAAACGASLQTWIPVDYWAAVFPTAVGCHWWRRKGLIRVAWHVSVQAVRSSCHRFQSAPGLTRV